MSSVRLQTEIVQQFCSLNGEQQHDLLLQLLQKTEGALRVPYIDELRTTVRNSVGAGQLSRIGIKSSTALPTAFW